QCVGCQPDIQVIGYGRQSNKSLGQVENELAINRKRYVGSHCWKGVRIRRESALNRIRASSLQCRRRSVVATAYQDKACQKQQQDQEIKPSPSSHQVRSFPFIAIFFLARSVISSALFYSIDSFITSGKAKQGNFRFLLHTLPI